VTYEYYHEVPEHVLGHVPSSDVLELPYFPGNNHKEEPHSTHHGSQRSTHPGALHNTFRGGYHFPYHW